MRGLAIADREKSTSPAPLLTKEGKTRTPKLYAPPMPKSEKPKKEFFAYS